MLAMGIVSGVVTAVLAATVWIQQQNLSVTQSQVGLWRGQIDALHATIEELYSVLQNERSTMNDMALRRQLEEERRVFLVQRGQLELLNDKLAHVRGRYLRLCSDYVKLLRQLPQKASPHSDVFTLSGARELEQLRQEQERYERDHANEEMADAN